MWLLLLTGWDARAQVLMPQGAGTLPGFPSFHSKGDVFRLSVNPSFLSKSKETGAGIILEKPWQIASLSLYHVEFIRPFKGITMNISARQFGNKEYTDRLLSLAAGKDLGKIDLGIRVGYRIYAVKGYGAVSMPTVQAGVLAELASSSHLFMSATYESSNISVDAGLHQSVSEQVMFGICLLKKTSQPLLVQANLIYQPHEKIEIDVGFVSGVRSFYFLTGYKLGSIKIRMGARFGSFTGTVPSVTMMYIK